MPILSEINGTLLKFALIHRLKKEGRKIEQITANYDIRTLLSQIDDIADKEMP